MTFDKEIPLCRVACAAKKCECARVLTQQAETDRNEHYRVSRIARDKRLKFIVEQFVNRLLDRDLDVWKVVAGRRTADSLFANDNRIEGYAASLIFHSLTNAATAYSAREIDAETDKFEQWAVENFGITPYSDETAQPTAVEPLIAMLSELEQRVNGWTFVDGEEWYQCLTQLRVLRSQLTMVTGLDDINGRCAALANTLRHYENVNAVTSDDEGDDDEQE